MESCWHYVPGGFYHISAWKFYAAEIMNYKCKPWNVASHTVNNRHRMFNVRENPKLQKTILQYKHNFSYSWVISTLRERDFNHIFVLSVHKSVPALRKCLEHLLGSLNVLSLLVLPHFLPWEMSLFSGFTGHTRASRVAIVLCRFTGDSHHYTPACCK